MQQFQFPLPLHIYHSYIHTNPLWCEDGEGSGSCSRQAEIRFLAACRKRCNLRICALLLKAGVLLSFCWLVVANLFLIRDPGPGNHVQYFGKVALCNIFSLEKAQVPTAFAWQGLHSWDFATNTTKDRLLQPNTLNTATGQSWPSLLGLSFVNSPAVSLSENS